jgi:dipeptidyl-peptidase 4
MKYIILFLSFYLSVNGVAQNKLTLDDALLKARTTLAPENLKGLQFIYGTTHYVYLKKIAGEEVWVKGSIKDAEKPLLNMTQAQEYFSNAQTGKLASMPTINFASGKQWTAIYQGYKIAYNPITKKQTVLVDKSLSQKTNLDIAVNGNAAYLENDNLIVTANGSTTQVTKDGSKDIVYASSVHRDEFGINKGTFWSADGKQLAFYRMDQGMVTDYPIIDWSKNPAVNENIKYPMAGGKSHHVTLGVYNCETKNTIYIKTGEPAEQYLTNIAWHPNGQYIFIAIVNRAQNEMKLNVYNATTGNFIKTLFTETDEKYIEPLVPMQIFNYNKKDQFIWQSNKEGFNNLYLYDMDGLLIKKITTSNTDVLENKGFDSKIENLFYITTDNKGLTKKLYRYNFKTDTNILLTTTDGVHSVQISTDGSTIIDNYSNIKSPRVIQLINNKTTKKLLEATSPLAAYEETIMDLFVAKNRHGDELNVKTYYPQNYNKDNKYPTIVYWYGGPHAQMVTNSWNAGAGDYWFKYMAQQGFIVIVPDVRGSDNRGKAFEQAMFREAGKVQMEDLEDILKYYDNAGVDKTKMGLFGWSFGGFMTTNFVLNHPGVFKAAVAGGPVMDWSLYEIMYTERYMDTPQENPDGYAATNLINQVGKLKDKLLLIHGLQDPVVVQQHSVNFIKAAVDKGVQVDYMIYPGHEHNVSGKDRLHLYQKISSYFIDHLK